MQLSIVSGTYNRLHHVSKMVNSVRTSVGIGIPYEIILVDGGSTDGTLDWAAEQPDVVLVEQGELLGAVKAFAAGFSIAQGKYVIIANDDIVFIDESIQRALAFMEDSPTVGIGCFYQDRYGKPWHIEYMSGVVDGKAVPVPYGQVCIIPRWLGNLAGWWDPGVGYHTYAGDNELSCNVYELGYDVQPIPCASIHDIVAQDELRAKNNNYTPGTTHPDSAKYVRKWTRKGMLGPVIPSVFKQRHVSDRQPRILYAPIYEKGHTLQHKTKCGLRNALTEADFIVSEVDYVANPLLIYDVANAFLPDIILTQFHDASIFNHNMVTELKSEHPDAVFINWNGDYFPEHMFNPAYMAMLKLYDIASFVTLDVADKYEAAGINWKYWQIGYEESNAVPDRTTKRHDVVFLGNGHYDFRVRLGRLLRSLQDVNVGLYGAWQPDIRADGRNLYDYDAGQRIYGAAKIAISDGRPGTKFVSNRIFQAMYAGCFTLQQWFPEMHEMLGYEDGVHYVTYKKTEDLPELIRYWLARDDERKRIAYAGKMYTLEHHSFTNRVDELITFIQDLP